MGELLRAEQGMAAGCGRKGFDRQVEIRCHLKDQDRKERMIIINDVQTACIMPVHGGREISPPPGTVLHF
ncbi:hypothetical protein KIN20_028785 [Parelaphostrongylus tenuis]|uniref:Uncharacterized protein n=1 Tax=Parelaphostrongylus tenuis TaxID=148309 RepID=A0AAD5WFC2_PARTN|nr:hypothetical protein KIN20_028785 [Parelaphostrongylus tenuis]